MAKKGEDSSTFQGLKADIKAKKPAHLYIFYGEEMFLLRYYLAALKKLLVEMDKDFDNIESEIRQILDI